MTDDPYPNTPRHTVLLHMAVGDHQVANVATQVEARRSAHAWAAGRRSGSHSDVHPFYGIEPITNYPYGGSALVVWDIGPLRAGDRSAPRCRRSPTRRRGWATTPTA